MIQNTDQLDNNNQPLVSIIVITYNSSKYVLETLESAKNQTYQNIELIISDDCSTDDTTTLCNEWLESNNARFVNVKLTIQKINLGVPANCNNGITNSKGKWLKIIAGDDILISNAIEQMVNFTLNNKSEILITQYQPFSYLDGETTFGEIYPNINIVPDFFNKSAKEQFKLLLKEKYQFILGMFVSRKLVVECDGFIEKYKLVEDLPFLIKISQRGFKFSYFPIKTVLYRTHVESISRSRDNQFSFNPKFIMTQYQIYYDLIRNDIPVSDRIYSDFKFGCYNFLIKNNIKSKWIIKIVLLTPIYLNPNFYLNRIKSFF